MIKNRFWKIIIIFSCLGMVTGTYFFLGDKIGIPKSKQWQTYSSRDQKFHIQFPSDPEETREQLDVANKKIDYHQFSAHDRETLYTVSYIDFPRHWKWLGTNHLLLKSFEMFVENEKGIEKVFQQELTTHKGHSALVYRLQQNGKEIQGKFVISGNTLYRVAMTYPLAMGEKAQTEVFFDSFQVKS